MFKNKYYRTAKKLENNEIPIQKNTIIENK